MVTSSTYSKLIRNSSNNLVPAKAVPIDHKRSPSKLDINIIIINYRSTTIIVRMVAQIEKFVVALA